MICRFCEANADLSEHRLPDADSGREYFTAKKCAMCETAFLCPLPSSAVLDSYYNASYYGDKKQKFSGAFEAVIDFFTTRRVKAIISLLSVKNGKIVDIGCGRGVLLRKFCDFGFECLGFERDVNFCEEKANLCIKKGDIKEENLAAESIDVVVLWHVLEHLIAPADCLKQIDRVLSKNGLLIVALPNNMSWQAIIFGSRWFHLDVPRHTFFFGHHALKKWLEKSHFRAEKESTFDPIQNVFGFVQSIFNWVLPGKPNKLYALMRCQISFLVFLKLMLWSVPVLILLPFAILESLVSVVFSSGASSILYLRKIS